MTTATKQRTPGPLATVFNTGSTILSDGSKVYHVDIFDRGARVLVHCITERDAENIQAALDDGSCGINVYHDEVLHGRAMAADKLAIERGKILDAHVARIAELTSALTNARLLLAQIADQQNDAGILARVELPRIDAALDK